MAGPATESRSEALEELEKIPSEFLPAVVKVLRAFREGLTLPAAQESFQRGWSEALSGETRPMAELWTDEDAD